MANPSDLILGVLFKANEDPKFKQIVRRLNSIVTEFNKGMDKAAQAEAKLTKRTKDLSKATKDLGKDMDGTKKIVDSTNKQIGKITNGIDRLIAAFKVVAVYTVAGRVFQGFQAAVSVGVKEIIEFDQALANLKAITGATDQEIQGMRDTLKDTALRTKFSTTEIAEGMVLLGQAGLTGAESIQAIDAVADLAAGTLGDFRSVADLVTTTLRAFNLEASETRRVADVMASAVNKSKLTIDKLRTAFNYVGAGAHQAGLSLETTASSMMILANNGLRASTIGTGLRQVLSRLLAPNAKLREAMSNYGLELDKASGKSDWFENQISKLASVMYNYETKTVDMSKAYSLFGLRGAQAAAILVNAFMSLDGTWELMNERAREVGTSSEMMQRQAEGLGFKIKNLSDSFGVLAVNLGEGGLTSVMKTVVDLMRDLVKAAGEVVTTGFGKMVSTFVGVAGALYTMRIAFLAIQTQLLENTVRAEKFRKAMSAFFLGPMGGVIIGIAAVAGALALLYHWAGKTRRELVKTITESQKQAGVLGSYLEKLKNVDAGSKEYYDTVERLKQALPEYSNKIDEISASYENLSNWMKETKKAQDALAFEKSKEMFALDMRKILSDMEENLNLGIAETGGVGDELVRKLFEQNPEVAKRVSEFTQDLFRQIINDFKEGKNVNEVRESVVDLFASDKVISQLRKEFPAEIDKVFGRVMAMILNYEKKMIASFVKLESTQLREVRRLIPEFGTLMDKLFQEKKYTQLVDLITAAQNALQKWIKQEKVFESILADKGLSEKEMDEELLRYKLAFFRKELEEYLKKEGKKELRGISGLESIRRAIDKLKGKHASAYEEEYRNADAFYTGLEDRVNKNVADQQEKKEMLLEIWKNFYAQLIEMANKYKDFPGALSPEIVKRMEELGKGAGIKGKFTVPTKENEPTGQIGYPTDREAARREIATIQSKKTEKDWRDEESTIEEEYRRGRASAEEYFKYIARLEREGTITHKEALKKKRTEQQNWWENIKEGWNDHFKEMQTTGEWLQELGGDLVEQLSTGFADAWGDFVTGAKSAQEAMADFARDTLRWLAQIFAKKMMMEALSWMGLHGGGMYGEQSFTRRMRRPAFVPKLHDGLMPNEFAAILTKDEAVFTPKQMKALGAMIKGTTEINVPVNISGAGADTAGKYMPQEIEQTVLKVMRKYM